MNKPFIGNQSWLNYCNDASFAREFKDKHIGITEILITYPSKSDSVDCYFFDNVLSKLLTVAMDEEGKPPQYLNETRIDVVKTDRDPYKQATDVINDRIRRFNQDYPNVLSLTGVDYHRPKRQNFKYDDSVIVRIFGFISPNGYKFIQDFLSNIVCCLYNEWIRNYDEDLFRKRLLPCIYNVMPSYMAEKRDTIIRETVADCKRIELERASKAKQDAAQQAEDTRKRKDARNARKAAKAAQNNLERLYRQQQVTASKKKKK